ncbi:sugar ABC transporter ATP-binding protein [Tumebacillus permanentifrigoris]|uniref:D-xylose transport system ATP-binding protein n=1 Tax=Tumebacillus permanentifrigoris TaxID=378543 RepID=A0A316DEM7_9BACL|nr:sugar ABC transporter ATP-binding protein [Tumebacillus permanentifrigoris]PWK16038.1 D-xylose transport system ATP-binding protein [Tumebacillus permanentifrigoris]
MIKLEMKGILKEFPGVRALNNVTFTAERGEVLALLGENGAGKSTLMKILSGVYAHGTYEGEILVDGQVCKFANTREAEHAGIAIIHQELNLIPGLSIAENVFLGREPKTKFGTIDWKRVHRETQELLVRLHLPFRPTDLVSALSVGQQQMIEIAKAISIKAEILVLDEPTSALTESEVEKLFAIIRELKAQNVTMIYISHKMDEIEAICDRITVLRDGSSVGSALIGDVTRNELITMMVGRDISQMFPKVEQEPGAVLLSLQNYSVKKSQGNGYLLQDINLQVRAGEVVGLAGLMGAGRTELVMSLFGALGLKSEGSVQVSGRTVHIQAPSDAIREGLALVTEDRKESGLVLSMNVRENTSLVSLQSLSSRLGKLDHKREQALAQRYINELRTKTPSAEANVNNLSGGNQQKVVLAKWLANNPKVLILDEPTRGIDVGAKVEIYQLINQLTAAGCAVIMISSELPEVLGMSDRILVMAEGRIAGELPRAQATQESIMKLATKGA